ncbi:hypothetical protein BDP55DRAFT_626563 [Colletotrichum godetiae]|uniref:Uncharacterized protein n=1 Tax=Colletotrichum godetiae TaxID=1209918 RepID=A0AAJ0AZX7_9PEZI|nr:uncharacterized protein BDP55DRAFT_626563 [Colletotrichum godetiae]KAK1699878.1 hypothetical protein BDP55DRAFT_626563 [Colletotrichum godetiae]
MTADGPGFLNPVKEEEKTFSIHHNPGCFICRLVFTTSPTLRMPLEKGQHCGLVYGYSYLLAHAGPVRWFVSIAHLSLLIKVTPGLFRAAPCCGNNRGLPLQATPGQRQSSVTNPYRTVQYSVHYGYNKHVSPPIQPVCLRAPTCRSSGQIQDAETPAESLNRGNAIVIEQDSKQTG